MENRQTNKTTLPALSPKLFDNIRHLKKRRWLAAYATTGGIRAASDLCGIDTRFHYLWLERDETGEYAEAFERARQIACDNAEDEVYRRGFRGYQRELHYKGHKTGDTITEYSDALASLFLKANREQYRDGSAAVIGPTHINLTVNVDDSPKLSIEPKNSMSLNAVRLHSEGCQAPDVFPRGS